MKKIVIGLLTLIFVISGICFYSADKGEVLAAAGDVTTGDGFVAVEYNDLKDYIKSDGNIAPEYTNYIFAGWYQDAKCEKVYSNVTADTTLAYAKFVPENVLSVKVQLKEDATSESASTNMRLVSSVDSANYAKVGFEVYYNGSEKPVIAESSKVFERIVASAESGVDYNYSAKVVDVESEYFVTATLVNIKKGNFGKSFRIEPYWITMDGTVVHGVGRYVTVNNGLDDDNINIPVKVGSGFDDEAAPTVTVGGNAPKSAEVAYYDGTYAHLNIVVENRKTALKSLSVITLTDGKKSESVEYRNLDTKYNGTEASIDTSWYDVKGPNKKKYVIATSADLYGLAELVNKPTYYFGNQTIYMIADIEVNKGRATENGWSTMDVSGNSIPGATDYAWTPIGTDKYEFVGTFDGQMHSIKGVCVNSSEKGAGLFKNTAVGSTIKNLKLENSYIKTTADYAGSIVASLGGNLKDVYSNAIVNSSGNYVGGLVGQIFSSGTVDIANGWYAGNVDALSNAGGIVGIITSGTATISNCLNSGNVTTTNDSTGGIIGRTGTSSEEWSYSGTKTVVLTIEKSLNTGNIKGRGSIGSVVGWKQKGSFTLGEAVYGTKTSTETKSGGTNNKWLGGVNGEYSGTATLVETEEITGNCAYFNKILDYSSAGAWALVPANSETGVAASTPVLKSFADIAGVKPALPKVVGNISWYTGLDKTEFVICDNADNAANVAELKGFAYLVNEGISFKNKTVTMDKSVTINEGTVDTWDTANGTGLDPWTPIGTATNEFAGTFDGKMNTISGIFVKTSEMGAGLFKNTADGSTIQNLKLENSHIETTGKYAGSVVASLGGNLINVYSNAKVNSNKAYVGGLVGQIFSSSNVNITNCWFGGELNGESNAGGIAGIITSGTATIKDCLNSGDVTTTGDSTGGIIGRTGTSSDEWNYSGSKTVVLTIERSLNAGNIKGRGNIGSVVGWKQQGTLTVKDTVYGTKTSTETKNGGTNNKWIGDFKAGYDGGTATLKETSDITGLRSYYNGILANTDAWVPTETTPALKVFTNGLLTEATNDINFDWYLGDETTEYTICDEDTNEANVAELKGFAYLVTHGIDLVGVKVTLANDVVLNEETIADLTADERKALDVWTPIGTTENKFAGTFDGGMHTISGLYVSTDKVGAGLFRGTAATSTIQNLKLKNAYITTSAQYAGSFVGSASGNLINLYSDADIVSSAAYNGGIVGQTWTNAGNDITISGCWFAGTMDVPSNAGGILGFGSKGNIKLIDCLNTGDITYTSNASKPAAKWVGGLVGRTLRSSTEWSFKEDTTATMSFEMRNCLNAGEVMDSKDYRVGSVLGQNNGPTLAFSNVYATNDSYKYDGTANAIGRNTSGGKVNVVGTFLVEESDITAEMAYYNKVLVNEENTAWSLTTETPVLTVFIDEATAVATPVMEDTIDISWYKGLGTITHEVCASDDNAENVKQLRGFAYLVNHSVDFDNMTVKLANDIAISGEYSDWDVDKEIYKSSEEKLVSWTPIGTAQNGFAGTFDGQMNTISGLFIKSSEQGLGLFKYTTEGSTIQNLKLVSSYIWSTNTGNAIVGSVVGSCGGNMTNVYSSAYVRSSATYAGGIAGQLHSTGNIVVDGCWFAGNVAGRAGSSNAGGIVGLISRGNITMRNCLNSGGVTVKENTSKKLGTSAGGLFGRTLYVTDRWALTGTATVSVTLEQCLAIGVVTGYKDIGSAIGWPQRGTLTIPENSSVYATTNSVATNGTSAILQGVATTNVTGAFTPVDIADIKGVSAQNVLEDLDFSEDGKWALINGGTPQLRAFADETKILAGDYSWYSPDSDEYIIDTAAELIAFSSLASNGETFKGKTIKLDADIDLNEGWTASTTAEAPATTWIPVGTTSKAFAGTFDGQGNTVSGIYVASEAPYIGFFGVTSDDAEIKNLRLTNSYFEQQVVPTNDEVEVDGFVGSIAGWLKGDMSNVYSDAILKSENRYTGGLVSWIKRDDTTKPVNITNCWFDGQIIAGTSARYIGGIAAGIMNGTCNMENVLYTGTITASYKGTKNLYLGGIVGEVKAISQALNMESAVSAGQIKGDHNGVGVHAVVGQVRTAVYNSGTDKANATNPQLTMKNVFATRDCRQTVYSVADPVKGTILVDGKAEEVISQVSVTGGVLLTTGDDRLIGVGTQETLNADASKMELDFAEAWTMRRNSVPVPTALADVAKETAITNFNGETLAKEIGLNYWNANASIKNAVAYGAGNYLVTYNTTETLTYDGYISKLVVLGFDKYADNVGTGMATDGILSATYYKEATATTGEWVLNITYVEKESKVYISINTDKNALDDNLRSAVQEGENAISLSMLEMINTNDGDKPYGNSFVFQLANGHFIVSDGGRAEDGYKLVEYLKNQAGNGDVIIDAWIITHYHDDHCGALNIFINDSAIREGIYLESVYACEPSSYALDCWGPQLGVVNKALRGAMMLTKTDGTRPDVYQLHMGQRYYFNGITMDVIDTQEQHPVATWGGANPDAFPDEFNTSSTNCVFTFTDKAGTTKKVLLGGDATTVNMEYIINVYGEDNEALKDIDVFAAYHHGHNMTATYETTTVKLNTTCGICRGEQDVHVNGIANERWIDFLTDNNTDHKFDVVLFSYNHIYSAEQTYKNSHSLGTVVHYYLGTDGNTTYPYNIGDLNNELIRRSDKAYTYENGTVKITFDGNNTIKVFGKGVFSE